VTPAPWFTEAVRAPAREASAADLPAT